MILAFCEPVYARPMGTEHIREVGPEGFKYGGGIPVAALCGFSVVKGWDLNRPVTGATIAALTEPRAEDLRGWLCNDCASEALALLAAPPSERGP
jgi:hypothetical protein